MIVMKFGGTSVGSAARMKQVVDLVSTAHKAGKKPVVVLSAMSGITNLLIAGAVAAVKRDLTKALSSIDEAEKKHHDAALELFGSGQVTDRLAKDISEKLEELRILYKGVSYLGELSKRSLDAISGMGEQLSSRLVAELASKQGLPNCWLDAREFIITDDNFGSAKPLWNKLYPEASRHLSPQLEQNKVVFTQGFIGRTTDGITTTLGRGGSDYSASIIGVAIDAEEIQIWTDVDGMMSADPRVVKEALVLPEVSFQEASELAYFGAKVLHPMTIRPAVEKDIPVRILNTLNPLSPGTLIKSHVQCNEQVRAVAAKKNITAIYLSSPNMLMSHGYLAKVFEIFNRYRVPVDLISTSEVSIALTIDNCEQLDELHMDLANYAEVVIHKDVAIVSVVGRQFREKSGIAGRIFKALDDINVLMISGGASDINLSLVVSTAQADQAVRQLHNEFFVCTKR
ncbi:MAG: lysine-sensitive aspartokinase 3 [Candidatus Obscuribacterales bacterium]|nr:lysine-sensitive aspartokinase 3 [Candidatus Obscuribacterales bacterium]